MKILIACEVSGRVRDAFLSLGHNAWSADVQSTDVPGPHLKGDVRGILDRGWDMLIAFPPCTHLCSSGARHWKRKVASGVQGEAIDFVQTLWKAPIKHIALENPIGILSSLLRPPDQIVQPYFFGDPVTKSTCLWLKRLPQLQPTDQVIPASKYVGKNGQKYDKYMYGHHANRGKARSMTFPGVAQAMANQWGNSFLYQAALF